MHIEFQGAARTVTGSMHVLRVNGRTILLDCGLYQGRREEARRVNSGFPVDPSAVDAVVLSHAHIDHSGNLPGLVRRGFRGPVYCTRATVDLLEVMLRDSAFIQERDAEFVNKKHRRKGLPPVTPLYTREDVEDTLPLLQGRDYGEPFEVRVHSIDGGHGLRPGRLEHHAEFVVGEKSVRRILGEDPHQRIVSGLANFRDNQVRWRQRRMHVSGHQLLNRRSLESKARSLMLDADHFAVAIADLDHFKDLNDTYGHDAGDRALRLFAKVMKDNLRPDDVAARYGGEEFVVVLPETDTEGADSVAERIREGVASLDFVGAEGTSPVHKTVSVGVATFPEHASVQGRLIEAADRAMYAAKRAGKNKVAIAR